MPSFTSERMTWSISCVSTGLQPAAGSSRLARQRAGDFQALERAVIERTGRPLRGVGEADAIERRARRLARRLVLPGDRGPMHQVSEDAGALVAVTADHDVLQHRHLRENLQVLERARQPAPRQPVGRKAGHRFAGKADDAVLRRVDAGNYIDQRGLARTVRADNREHLAGRDRNADPVDGAHAAEGDRQLFGFQDRHLRHPAKTPASDGTMPLRRKIMNTMTISPSSACSYS
jgi:hypothetical protein